MHILRLCYTTVLSFINIVSSVKAELLFQEVWTDRFHYSPNKRCMRVGNNKAAINMYTSSDEIGGETTLLSSFFSSVLFL